MASDCDCVRVANTLSAEIERRDIAVTLADYVDWLKYSMYATPVQHHYDG